MSSHEQAWHGNEESVPCDAGTPIGVRSDSSPSELVHIPPDMRCKNTHIIGAAGTGKSIMMESMILADIRRGEGVVVLDAGGWLTNRLLCLLPREAIERTVCFSFSDPDWVPLWNPLQYDLGVDRARIADGIVRALVNGSPFGCDRTEHLLRHVFLSLLHLPGATVRDAAKLLNKESADGHRLRSRILEAVDNEFTVDFWKHEYTRYMRTELSAPRRLLSRLLVAENVGAMLSQPMSSFSIRDVMDTAKILLVDLSHVGTEACDVLGSFMLSSLYLTAMGRASNSEQRRRKFNIYCEEAHRFTADSLEGLLLEMRTSAVNLTLSHQSVGQLGTRLADAMSVVGSRVNFRVSADDAKYLTQDLQGKARGDELITLRMGQAIARIGDRVVRLTTIPPRRIPQHHFRDEIMARCHKLYYMPSEATL